MKLAMTHPYSGDFRAFAAMLPDLERAGLDAVLLPEAYSFDVISQIGYLAAITERMEIGTGIVNVYSRTPALLGMTAAGCDHVTGGRFILGLGASGPQVVEGFHAVPFVAPLARTQDVIEVVRKTVRREVVAHDGPAVTIPLPQGQGTGLGRPLKLVNRPDRPAVPVWWAALKTGAVRAAARLADGWIPFLFFPERAKLVWGEALAEGTALRAPELGSLDVFAGGRVAIGADVDVDAVRDAVRPQVALYVGGMGARGKNFYNDIATGYGFGAAAKVVQDLYLDGKKKEAEAALPTDLLDGLIMAGPAAAVADRVAAYRDAGVTYLEIIPHGGDPVRIVERMRAIVDA
ncbi:LLM class F420-dependent oxidoreductase [Frankia canadensis]|uniref:LLM class F420-dependent oxidoreductase n=1 Tax=Frankia canadensis TaxID=1836972 RepID=A0A2I2KI10_9ACTN|nr:LLM class F420-dependent oxidoreductase [Frankia canadensis]SNQ45310.1 LLM class F420-dependent oxidoreductase [Frankia canadensis]SOU52600.1 LLM class F420-dependent oxidoreductase [Frankia canadensis]